jgi:hypothetical protein
MLVGLPLSSFFWSPCVPLALPSFPLLPLGLTPAGIKFLFVDPRCVNSEIFEFLNGYKFFTGCSNQPVCSEKAFQLAKEQDLVVLLDVCPLSSFSHPLFSSSSILHLLSPSCLLAVICLRLLCLLHLLFLLQHSAFHIPHSAFRIPHSAFRIPHSVFRIPSLHQPFLTFTRNPATKF